MYEAIIKDVARTIPVPLTDREAAGVEGSMRLQYGTLDHLPRSTFRDEILIALSCEGAEPGYLEKVAASYAL